MYFTRANSNLLSTSFWRSREVARLGRTIVILRRRARTVFSWARLGVRVVGRRVNRARCPPPAPISSSSPPSLPLSSPRAPLLPSSPPKILDESAATANGERRTEEPFFGGGRLANGGLGLLGVQIFITSQIVKVTGLHFDFPSTCS